MGQNKWQKEREYPWGTDVGEKQKRIYGESLGTQQQWSTSKRVIGDCTHEAADNFERTMGTMHKAGDSSSETNAFQSVQR